MASVQTLSRRFVLSVSSAAALAVPQRARGEPVSFPERPVRLVVPFTPGAAPDFMARLYGEALTNRWNPPPIVENRPGAAGQIGAEAVARARADGYSLLVTIDSVLTSSPHLSPTPYATDALTAVSKLGTLRSVLCVNPQVQAGSLAELIELARREPDRLAYGHSGTGSPQHLSMATLAARAKVRMTGVGYRGGAPTITDLVGGSIQVLFGFTQTLMPHVKAGRIRPIAVGTPTRLPELPDIATVRETFPDFRMETWVGAFAATATPQPLLSRLEGDLLTAAAIPSVSSRLLDAGITPDAEGREMAQRRVASDFAAWGDAIRRYGIEAG